MFFDSIDAHAPDDDQLEEIREEIYASADTLEWPSGLKREQWISAEMSQAVAEFVCEARGTRSTRWRDYLDEARVLVRKFEKRRLDKVSQ